MDTEIIPFVLLKENEHWKSTNKHAVQLICDVTCKFPYKQSLSFYCKDILLATLHNGELTIHAGYACDGYSPVIRLFKWWIRLTPTPTCGMFPAILHDFLRQFIDVENCPWRRSNTDDEFFNSLAGGGNMKTSSVYHGAVAGIFGDLFLKISTKKDNNLRVIKGIMPKNEVIL